MYSPLPLPEVQEIPAQELINYDVLANPMFAELLWAINGYGESTAAPQSEIWAS